jgi:hypothetical protein
MKTMGGFVATSNEQAWKQSNHVRYQWRSNGGANLLAGTSLDSLSPESLLWKQSRIDFVAPYLLYVVWNTRGKEKWDTWMGVGLGHGVTRQTSWAAIFHVKGSIIFYSNHI